MAIEVYVMRLADSTVLVLSSLTLPLGCLNESHNVLRFHC
jgi:hypothetical protein